MEDMDDQSLISATELPVREQKIADETVSQSAAAAAVAVAATSSTSVPILFSNVVGIDRIYDINQRYNNNGHQTEEGNVIAAKSYYKSIHAHGYICRVHGRPCTPLMQSQYCSKIQTVRRDAFRNRTRPYWKRQRSRTHSETADSSTLAHLQSIKILSGSSSCLMPSDTPMIDVMDISTTTNNNNISDSSRNNRYRDMSSSRIALLVTKIPALKKAKSLEDIRSENLDGSQPSHEMEFVSSRIQKLKVHE